MFKIPTSVQKLQQLASQIATRFKKRKLKSNLVCLPVEICILLVANRFDHVQIDGFSRWPPRRRQRNQYC